MSDWRETEGDCWGPTEIGFRRVRISIGDAADDELVISAEPGQDKAFFAYPPVSLVRALLRAHDLRTKAPGTECKWCHWPGHNFDCNECHGSGRALTPDELERWRALEGVGEVSDHVVSDANDGGALKCLNCGARLKVELPAPLQYFCDIAKAFDKTHKGCKPKPKVRSGR